MQAVFLRFLFLYEFCVKGQNKLEICLTMESPSASEVIHRYSERTFLIGRFDLPAVLNIDFVGFSDSHYRLCVLTS